MKNAGCCLLPTIIFKSDHAIDFEGFSKKESTIIELFYHAKAEYLNLHENDINEIMCVDNNGPIVGSLSDVELIESGTGSDKLQSDQSNSDFWKSKMKKNLLKS